MENFGGVNGNSNETNSTNSTGGMNNDASGVINTGSSNNVNGMNNNMYGNNMNGMNNNMYGNNVNGMNNNMYGNNVNGMNNNMYGNNMNGMYNQGYANRRPVKRTSGGVIALILFILIGLGVLGTVGVIAITYFAATVEMEPISNSEFKEICEDEGLTVEDIMSHISDDVQEATLAYKDDVQLEFYVLSNEDKALDFYDALVEKIKDRAGDNGVKTEINLKNHRKYEATVGSKYMFASVIDNTVMCSSVPKSAKDEVKQIVDDETDY